VAEPCLTCGGTGQTKSEKKYSVNIESGTENGKKICLRGQGNPSLNGRPPGDLVLTIKVEPHRFFMSKGLDIHCEIPIDQKRAKHGTKVRVKTIYGSTVELQVPRNTINGKVFRLKGMGVKRKETSGDQFVKITVA
jgi:molecular chaperone DnaJ